jgi:hypothetical protein
MIFLSERIRWILCLTISLTSGHGATGLAQAGRLLPAVQVLSPGQAKVKPETNNRHKTAIFFFISFISKQIFIEFPKEYFDSNSAVMPSNSNELSDSESDQFRHSNTLNIRALYLDS